MGVIRGRLFTDREIVTTGQTIGKWPFLERDDGTWIDVTTGDHYVEVSFEKIVGEVASQDSSNLDVPK